MISQQSIQLIGDKIKSKPDPNQHKLGSKCNNLLNIHSSVGHYGTHYWGLPNGEVIRSMKLHEKSISQHKNILKAESNVDFDDCKHLYSHQSKLNNRKGRNYSTEGMESQSKCQSNRSPMLTKRRYSQKRGGISTVRNKYSHPSRSKRIQLNNNLYSLSQKEDRK